MLLIGCATPQPANATTNPSSQYTTPGGAVVPSSVLLLPDPTNQNSVVQNSASNPLHVNCDSGCNGGGTFTVTGAAALPSLSAGANNLYESLSGGLFTQLIYGSNIVGTSFGLPIQGQGAAGTASGGVVSVQGVASMTPVQVTTNASMGSLAAGGSSAPAFAWGIGGIYQTSPVSGSNGNFMTALMNAYGALQVDLSYFNGAPNSSTNSPFVQSAPLTSGGWSTYAAIGGTGNALLTTTAVAVKAAAGTLHSFTFYNPNNTVAYCQLFDVAQGSVTVGTTVPKESYGIPAQGWYDKIGLDIAFGTAITIACSTTATGNTAPGTGITANVEYK